MEVVLTLISVTVPLKPLISMMSPTLYWLSIRINIPVTMSAMRLSAPKPIMRAIIPSPARMVTMSTLNTVRIIQNATMMKAYCSIFFTSEMIVFTLLLFGLNNPNTKVMIPSIANAPKIIRAAFRKCVKLSLISGKGSILPAFSPIK